MLTEAQKQRNADRIATLLPEVQKKAWELLSQLAAEDKYFIVPQAMRTMDEQAELYAQGRTKPGKKVTNSQPGYSWHNFGRAFDIALVGADGKILWSGPEYAEAGRIGAALGLVWGGGFKSIKGDIGHFEYHPGLTLEQARHEAGLSA